MVVETSSSGHEVLAMGCAAHQRIERRLGEQNSEQDGEQDGGARGRGLIVVLDGGGEELADQDRVLEAMERFSPTALVWVYEEGANPPMRGLVGRGGKIAGYSGQATIGSAVVQDPRATAPKREEARPKLRLAGRTEDRAVGRTGDRSGEGLTASDVLDGDELAALLKPNE